MAHFGISIPSAWRLDQAVLYHKHARRYHNTSPGYTYTVAGIPIRESALGMPFSFIYEVLGSPTLLEPEKLKFG